MSFKAIKVILSAGAALSLSALPGAARAKDKPPVIEVVTLNLKHGVTPADFGKTIASATTWLFMASIKLLTRRVARSENRATLLFSRHKAHHKS